LFATLPCFVHELSFSVANAGQPTSFSMEALSVHLYWGERYEKNFYRVLKCSILHCSPHHRQRDSQEEPASVRHRSGQRREGLRRRSGVLPRDHVTNQCSQEN